MLRNRKGSATILIMLLFVTLVSMVMIFVKVAKSAGIRSSAKELGLVWYERGLGRGLATVAEKLVCAATVLPSPQ